VRKTDGFLAIAAGNSWMIETYYKCFDGETDRAALLAARAEHAKTLVGLTGHPPASPFETAWVMVSAALGAAPGTVDIDTSGVNGTIAGVRYGWVGDCNGQKGKAGTPHLVKNCPLMSDEGLPANPFMAKVTAAGKCACLAPQKCDA
jgi:hypothetical protein